MNLQKKLKVFLIEDAQRVRAALTDILQESGQIEVVGFAADEQDALQQLRSREWDVAIVDIGLREGNGLGVLAGLKNDAREYGKRLVFTSNSSNALKARTAALGADGCFDKSTDIGMLVSRIRDMLH
ncbi:MAG: response regulator [Burkholderiaceae bacterium]